MSADFNQPRGHGAHGAVVGWKSLIELGHHSTDGWFIFNQINFYSGFCQIKGCLHASNSAAENHGGTDFFLLFCV